MECLLQLLSNISIISLSVLLLHLSPKEYKIRPCQNGETLLCYYQNCIKHILFWSLLLPFFRFERTFGLACSSPCLPTFLAFGFSFPFCAPWEISKWWIRLLYNSKGSTKLRVSRNCASNCLRTWKISCFIWYGTLCTTRAHKKELGTTSDSWFWSCWSRKLENWLNRCHKDRSDVAYFFWSFLMDKPMNSWSFHWSRRTSFQ